MAFSNGAFSLLYTWGEMATLTDRIKMDALDSELEGIATGLSTCILTDGSATVTADISLDSHKLIDVADPTAAQDAATKAYVDGAHPTQSAIADITDNTGGGTPDGTLVAVSGSGADAAINDNLADLAGKINAVLAALRSANIIST